MNTPFHYLTTGGTHTASTIEVLRRKVERDFPGARETIEIGDRHVWRAWSKKKLAQSSVADLVCEAVRSDRGYTYRLLWEPGQ